MKKTLIVLAAMLIAATAAMCQQRMDSLYFHYLEHKKSPGLAFCLSFLLPVGGQFYNGDAGRAFFLGSCMIAGPLIAVTAGFRDSTIMYSGYMIKKTETTPYFTLGILLGTSAYIYSIIDAPARANSKNKELKKKLNLTAEVDKMYLSFYF